MIQGVCLCLCRCSGSGLEDRLQELWRFPTGNGTRVMRALSRWTDIENRYDSGSLLTERACSITSLARSHFPRHQSIGYDLSAKVFEQFLADLTQVTGPLGGGQSGWFLRWIMQLECDARFYFSLRRTVSFTVVRLFYLFLKISI